MNADAGGGVPPKQRLIVGITGASGIIFGTALIDALHAFGQVETHLVMTDAARVTLAHEMGISPQSIRDKVHVEHDLRNIAAPIASGSFITSGMVVAPCSMKTLASIAYCHSDNLLTRAADVCLKERRPLILLPRETPLHLGHLRAMVAAAEIGAVVMPPVPAFYNQPKTIDDIVNHIVGKVLDQLHIQHDILKRWGEQSKEGG
jgi:polyprenyl P-hydroxybenzoate/phenylacrylic acid decarboxylase-like protein